MKNISIGLHQTQKIVISPQLQHAIKLLQLSSLELVEKIETELSENPFLEENEDHSEEKKENKDIADEEFTMNQEKRTLELDINKREINFDASTSEHFFEDSSDFGYLKKSSVKSDENSKQQFLENAFAVETTLYEHLVSQLRLISISDIKFHICEIIISSLNDDGYFKVSVEEVAHSVPCSVEDVLSSLQIIQTLEPPGVGGRNLQEVLLVQIEQLDIKNKLAEEIIKNYLKLLEKGKYKELTSKLETTTNEIKKAIKYISKLEPIPARQFDKNKTKFIVPDISVEKIDDGFSVSINDHFFPNLKLNNSYKEILRHEKLDHQAKEFFNHKYSEAKLLIFSLEKRKSTISKVVEQLINHQRDFFKKGPQYLKPLVLKDIAEKIDMHESTISRVTANKYMDTPWGIFNLKYFFSSGIRKSSGEMKSSRSIKEIIKKIIVNEQSNKVLSDEKIVKVLSNQGIKIARRTVAKYRKSLKILPSFRRKEI